MSSCGTIHKSVVSHLYFCRVLPLLLEPWDYTGIRWRKADTQRNERKLQLPMNNHETEGAGGQAATRPTALRNTNTGSTLVFFFIAFYFLTRRQNDPRKRESKTSVLGRIFFLRFIRDLKERDSSRQQVTLAEKLMMIKARVKHSVGEERVLPC